MLNIFKFLEIQQDININNTDLKTDKIIDILIILLEIAIIIIIILITNLIIQKNLYFSQNLVCFQSRQIPLPKVFMK